ncbi:hypothetical protein BT69DRAFT_370970 [Atractiella rhizophila]|nr:hypothetical protein BT69DRAFT_370970 [Atractiella rhizophila]
MKTGAGVKPQKRTADPAILAAEGRVPFGAKRPRTKRHGACVQCRKQKARCEPSATISKACHRCFTLTIPCSLLSPSDIPSNSESPSTAPVATSSVEKEVTFTVGGRQALVDALWTDSTYQRLLVTVIYSMACLLI